MAIIDTQTVKCILVRGSRGFNAAKRILERKRVAMVDAYGHQLTVAVIPASVQERDTSSALDNGKAAWPSLRVTIVDGAFTADRCREWPNLYSMRHEVVARPPGQGEFAMLPRRQVVEQSFDWLTHRAARCTTVPFVSTWQPPASLAPPCSSPSRPRSTQPYPNQTGSKP